MSIYFIVGLPHHGKSLYSAWKMQKILRRNKRWYKKTGKFRKVYTNLILDVKVIDKWKDYIVYWNDPLEISKLEDVDIFWDEVARHLDARDWDKLPIALKDFLQQHDKVGVDIYANTQTPMQVDIAFRRLCEGMWHIQKWFGSRRPSHTKPPVSYIWGLCVLRKVKRSSFSKELDMAEYEHEWLGIPFMFLWIDKWLCRWYDTRAKIIQGAYPLYQHIERNCEDIHCVLPAHKRIMHL